MRELDFNIKIAHLYPDLLNIYGDLGNVVTVKKRCEWRGIKTEVTQIKAGGKINPEDFDFYFIGGGQDGQQILASSELLKNKSALKEASDSDAVFLGICGGYQLLGHYYLPKEGEKLEGISLLDCYTVAGDKRLIGNVSAKCSFLYDPVIAGFENHSGLTYLNGETKPFMKIVKGWGNNGKDKTEGARCKNVFGTYLHGPLLPKNPLLCDYLIYLALKRKYKCEIPIGNLEDDIEEKTKEYCFKLGGK